MRRTLFVLVTALCAFTGVTGAGAFPAASADLYVMFLVDGNPVRDGASRTTNGHQFSLEIQLLSNGPDATEGAVELEVPAGITWPNGLLGAADGCTGSTTLVCSPGETIQPPPPAFTGFGWRWNVAAQAAGSYAFRVRVVNASATDSVPVNDSVSASVVVPPASGGGGGGGGSVSVSVGAVKLSAAKSKAGSTVVASVTVARGGVPVRPTAVSCSGSIGTEKIRGRARAAAGVASCSFRTPKTAKGKTLAGSIAFRAGGQNVRKRFSTRLG